MTRDRTTRVGAGLLLAAWLVAGCATAPAPQLQLPPQLDVETLSPRVPDDIDLRRLTAYPDRIVDGREDTCGLPSGTLLSPRAVFARDQLERNHERLLAENTALRNLRVDERKAAEDLRRAALQRIDADSRALAWRPWIAAGAFVVGVVAGGWAVKR